MDVIIGDTVDIRCPHYPDNTPRTLIEYHSIYQVTREEYESCRVTFSSSTTRHIFSCDEPFNDHYYTIAFREFTPMPLGLEFKPGHDYYYISTSNGSESGLYNLAHGKCESHNMKMIFKVCCDNQVDDEWEDTRVTNPPHFSRLHPTSPATPPHHTLPSPTPTSHHGRRIILPRRSVKTGGGCDSSSSVSSSPTDVSGNGLLVTIGDNSVVTKDLPEPGKYHGETSGGVASRLMTSSSTNQGPALVMTALLVIMMTS